MQALQESLRSCVKLAVDQYVEKLAGELKVDKEKALAIWNSTVADELKVVNAPAAKAPAKAAAPKKSKKGDDDGKKCQYTYQKGDKEGDMCGARVSDESETGCFCKKHVSHEKKGEEKKSKGKAAGSSAAKKPVSKGKKADAKEAESSAVAHLKETAPVFSVKKNQWNNYEHDGTGFLFDRKTEEVYGIQRPDGTVAPLTSEDVDTCKYMGLKHRLPERLASRADKDADEEEEIVDSDDDDDEDDD